DSSRDGGALPSRVTYTRYGNASPQRHRSRSPRSTTSSYDEDSIPEYVFRYHDRRRSFPCGSIRVHVENRRSGRVHESHSLCCEWRPVCHSFTGRSDFDPVDRILARPFVASDGATARG